jgi:RNA polymerase subunit RPABC4/transcription elongation factor Spt4
MSNRSPFVFVFWGLVVLVGFLLVSIIPVLFLSSREPGSRALIMVVPLFLLVTIYFMLVPTLVYRDAAKRGLDPWLWATVATFVPNLIGVVIYLVMRNQANRVCVSCNKALRADFKVCPYCGKSQDLLCPQCQGTVATEWKVCPHCGHQLSSSA